MTANKRAAKRDAGLQLGRLMPPIEAKSVEGKPRGGGSALNAPQSVIASPNVVERHSWWVVPDPVQKVLAFVQAHPPSGSRLESSGSGGRNGRMTSWSLRFSGLRSHGVSTHASCQWCSGHWATAQPECSPRLVAFIAQHRPRGQQRVENGARSQVMDIDQEGTLTLTLDGSDRRLQLERHHPRSTARSPTGDQTQTVICYTSAAWTHLGQLLRTASDPSEQDIERGR